MPEPAIQVRHLSKQYRIGASTRPAYGTLRDSLVRAFRSVTGRQKQTSSAAEHIWALRDVDFEVQRGEVVGIIGRNGAGKSTLLRVLSRITEPSLGEVRLRGRLGSLLEVGTGFHPELTGRENTYLSGAILGMKAAEISMKLDAIVAFAEIERFIDTPVKHYSSGMYVRLAFSVAAHLQPEILLVDEVLAVGDIAFQRKCIGRMGDVAKEGRTVLLVTHSLSVLRALCSRALLLSAGRLVADGPTEDVATKYLGDFAVDSARKEVRDEDHRTGVRQLRLRSVRLLDGIEDSFAVCWTQPIRLEMEIEVLTSLKDLAFGLGIRGMDGTHVFTIHQDDDPRQTLWNLDPGQFVIRCEVENLMRPGIYALHIGADIGHLMQANVFIVECITLEVLDHSPDGKLPEPSNTGIVNGRARWENPRPVSP